MSQNVVSFQSVRFGYAEADVLTVDGFEVGAGERVLISGASGAGKSTLLALMTGVLIPRSGQVSVLGRSYSEMSSSERDRFRSKHIGYIFQSFNLIPYLSVLENVLLPGLFSGSNRSMEEAVKILESLKIEPSLLEQQARDLSLGQQQRVACARALLGHPELIVADEPTSALDTSARESFLNLLFEQAKASNASLVLVSHDESLRSFFDRRVEIQKGELK